MSDLISQNPPRVGISNHAMTDLEEIWSHFSEKGEDAAVKVLKQITDKFSKLPNFPKIGKERNDLLIGLRVFPAGKFVNFYQEMDFGIEVVRVAHGARDLQQLFDEMIPLEP